MLSAAVCCLLIFCHPPASHHSGVSSTMTAPPDDDDAGFSPFARTTAAPSPTDKGGGPTPTAAAAPPHDQRGGTSSRLSDLDDVNAMAAEAGDDLAPLPDVAAASGGAGLAYSKGPASASAGCTTLPPGAGSDDGNSAFCSAGGAASKPSRPKRKLIPLKQVCIERQRLLHGGAGRQGGREAGEGYSNWGRGTTAQAGCHKQLPALSLHHHHSQGPPAHQRQGRIAHPKSTDKPK